MSITSRQIQWHMEYDLFDISKNILGSGAMVLVKSCWLKLRCSKYRIIKRDSDKEKVLDIICILYLAVSKPFMHV